jgi:uncharacterized protein YndB with AHSA1/START domain
MSKNRISDEAVHKATGRVWSEWVRWLDEQEAAALSHKEIVALLRERGEVESAWWQQSIAVGYERARGLREFGQRRDAGFEIGVQRTVPLSADEAWRRLTGPDGVRAWLGDAPSLRLEVGEAYRLADGTAGEVRIVAEGERVRITRHPNGWARASTIQIRVTPKGEKSVIAFHEENLPDAEAREARRAHFQEAIAEIVKH